MELTLTFWSRGRRQKVSGQLCGFWPLRFYPLLIPKFVDLSIQKPESKLTWYFHANSAFLSCITAWKVSKYGPEITPYLDTFHPVHSYAITFVLSSRAVGNTTTVLPICAFQKEPPSKINYLFIFLSLFKNVVFTIDFVKTQLLGFIYILSISLEVFLFKIPSSKISR